MSEKMVHFDFSPHMGAGANCLRPPSCGIFVISVKFPIRWYQYVANVGGEACLLVWFKSRAGKYFGRGGFPSPQRRPLMSHVVNIFTVVLDPNKPFHEKKSCTKLKRIKIQNRERKSGGGGGLLVVICDRDDM